MNHKSLALVLFGMAAVLVVVGALVYTGALSWFGRLPGDIRYESQNTRVFVPLTSMFLVSLLLSLAMYLARRFF
jgi:hypothetical protein